MKISRAEIGNVLKGHVQRTEGAAGSAERQKASETKSPQGDTLTLSSQAQEIQRIRQLLDRVPEVREERVRPLAESVAKGTYQAEAGKVADQMIARMLGDKLV